MEDTGYTQKIEAFFDAYASRFQQALQGIDDVDATAAAFAECFIEAHPKGVTCGKNDAAFRKMIPQGNDHYRKIGTQEMRVRKIESSRLDENHYMAKVFWHSSYVKKGGETVHIPFSVIYLLQEIEGVLSVFCYIAGDEQGLLKEHGVIE